MANTAKFDSIFAAATPKALRPGAVMQKVGLIPEAAKSGGGSHGPKITNAKSDNSNMGGSTRATGMSLSDSEDEQRRRRENAGLNSVLASGGSRMGS